MLGVTLGSPVIQYFGWRTLFWGQLVLLVIASAVVAVLLPSTVGRGTDVATWHGRRRTSAGDRGGRRRRRAVRQRSRRLGRHGLGGELEPGRVRHRRHAGPEHRPHRRLDVAGGDHLRASLAVVLAVVFVRRELTFATPLVPTTYWRRRNFMFPMGTKAFSSFAYFGGFFLFPLLMEQVYGYSVSQVGFISVARPLLFAISAPIAGYMTVRTGERTATLFGTGSLLLSMILFATLSASAGLGVILVALALSGLGMGVSMPATSATMSNELAASEYGVMSAAQLLAAQVGEVAGIQAVLTIQESIARRVGPGQRAPQPGAAAQLQRPVLGRRRRRRAGRGLRAVHPAAAPRRAGRRSGWPTPADALTRRRLGRSAIR